MRRFPLSSSRLRVLTLIRCLWTSPQTHVLLDRVSPLFRFPLLRKIFVRSGRDARRLLDLAFHLARSHPPRQGDLRARVSVGPDAAAHAGYAHRGLERMEGRDAAASLDERGRWIRGDGERLQSRLGRAAAEVRPFARRTAGETS